MQKHKIIKDIDKEVAGVVSENAKDDQNNKS